MLSPGTRQRQTWSLWTGAGGNSQRAPGFFQEQWRSLSQWQPSTRRRKPHFSKERGPTGHGDVRICCLWPCLTKRFWRGRLTAPLARSTVPFPHLCSPLPRTSCHKGLSLSSCPSALSRHCGLASSMTPHRRDGVPVPKRKSSILCTPAFLLAGHDDGEQSTAEPAGRRVTQKQPDTPQAGPP